VAEPCTCPLGADECDNGSGVFLPLGHGGSCAVRPCQKPVDRHQQEEVRRVRWDAHGVGVMRHQVQGPKGTDDAQ
jgi:hypothetical protein